MKAFSGFVFLCLLLCIVAMLAPLSVAQTKVSDVPACSQHAFLDAVTATTKIIPAVAASSTKVSINGVTTTTAMGSRHVHICSVTYRVKQDVAAATFGLVTGTGADCVTGPANLTPQWLGTASVVDALTTNFGTDAALTVPNAKDVCLALSATPVKAQIEVTYATY